MPEGYTHASMALRAAESDARSTQATLRAQMADELAVAVREALTERLTPADHARLIDNSLKKVVLN